jgi:hypothetical protein
MPLKGIEGFKFKAYGGHCQNGGVGLDLAISYTLCFVNAFTLGYY